MDDPSLPIAEINRRVRFAAQLLGLPRPSYEQVRPVVRAKRRGYRAPGVGETLLEISLRAAPPQAIVDVLAGTAPPGRRK